MTTMRHNPMPVSIDDDVEFLTEQIQALKELARHDHVSEDQVYDLSIRWGVALAGRLRRLVHYSSLGLLDDVDEARFGSLCTELRAVSDLIARFGLSRPALPGV
jgi:ribosomal protein S15P/S13E